VSVDSTPRSDLTASTATAPADAGAVSSVEPTTPPEPPSTPPPAPPRPVWNSVVPAAPWCPDEWREHLDAVAPGLFASGTAASTHEATGDILQVAPWTLVMASRRGRLHAHRGDHREDAGHLLPFPGGWCAAVADGAGSASFSRLGSAIATATVTHALREALRRKPSLAPAMREAAHAANEAQRTFAARAGIALREFRTTLLVAARLDDTLAVMQVGDGAMALLHEDGLVSHPHAAATGDYSGEVAHFLPDEGALAVLQASVRTMPAHGVCAVLLASDGVDDPWYPFTRWARPLVHSLAHGANAESERPASLVPSWPDSVLRAADPVHALTEWLAFEKRGENDDRTLCLAYTDALLAAGTAS